MHNLEVAANAGTLDDMLRAVDLGGEGNGALKETEQHRAIPATDFEQEAFKGDESHIVLTGGDLLRAGRGRGRRQGI